MNTLKQRLAISMAEDAIRLIELYFDDQPDEAEVLAELSSIATVANDLYRKETGEHLFAPEDLLPGVNDG